MTENKKLLKSEKGFTLIELMITVAIVGILAALALPAYQDYTIRAQATEGLALASGAKVAVADYYANKGTMTGVSTGTGYSSAAGKYVTGVSISETGEITAVFGNEANAKLSGLNIRLTATPDEASGVVVWNCESSAAQKYLPSSCKADGTVTDPGTPGGGTPTDPGTNPGGGTNPTDPGTGTPDPDDDEGSTPITPPVSNEINFGENFRMVNGKLTYWNMEITEMGQPGSGQYDASMINNIPGYTNHVLSFIDGNLVTQGSINGIQMGGFIKTLYDDQSSNQVTNFPYRTSRGNMTNETIEIVNIDPYSAGYNKYVETSSIDIYSAINTLKNAASQLTTASSTPDFEGNPTSPLLRAENSINNAKQTIQSFIQAAKDANGGNLPGDFPKALVNSSYNS